MEDWRPIGYVIGLLVLCLGGSMLIPLALDVLLATEDLGVFALSAFITSGFGAAMALSCASAAAGLTRKQMFILTTLSWAVLPVFGALPLWIGIDITYTDAFFEAMSGFTTTGSTILSGIDHLPKGLQLWRGMMQWFGGVGIVVVAMVFLPTLRVGGMQVFRSEAFDTMGKILPRAAEIARSISGIYVAMTLACLLAYRWAGLDFFDALVHSMTTIATGGLSNYDSSFADMPHMAEYVASVFMLLAALPFVRYVQLIGGSAGPLIKDSQIQVFFGIAVLVVGILTLWQIYHLGFAPEAAFRQALFNSISVLTGTGYASENYETWGAFPITLIFMVGLIGGCAGSTCCSIKVFRYQLLWAALRSQIMKLHSPSGVLTPRYQGRPVSEEAMASVMAFFVMFLVSLGVLSIALGMLGLDTITALSGAATALANIGPGLGPEIGPSGNFGGLPDAAKWLLSLGMLVGRLELMSVFVLLSLTFWRS